MSETHAQKREKLRSTINKKLATKASLKGPAKKSSYDRELKCIESTALHLQEHGLELRQWQDGTRSDFGVRLFGAADSWLPIQLKSTAKAQFPFTATKAAGYNCDVLFICNKIRYGVWWFPRELLIKHSDKMMKRKGIPCDVYIQGPATFWDRCRMPLSELANVVTKRLEEHGGCTELELRMQCSPSCQVELKSIQLFRLLHPDSKFEWPAVRNGVFDQTMDGKRQQFKSANSNRFVNLTRHWNGDKGPYAVGDCDEYVVTMFHGAHFVMWRFPESAMSSHGVLSTFDGTGKQLATIGQQGLKLRLPPGAYSKVGLKKPMYHSQSEWTAQYCTIHANA